MTSKMSISYGPQVLSYKTIIGGWGTAEVLCTQGCIQTENGRAQTSTQKKCPQK